jgi:dihydrolipoamide dehydrogenase
MRSIAEDRHHKELGVSNTRNLSFYPALGEFVSDYTMRVGSDEITAKNIFLVSGARPDIPHIMGIEKVDYLTYLNVWELRVAPRSMVIVGGGYIAAEMAHFFSSMGVDVTVLSRSPWILRDADRDVSDLLTKSLSSRIKVVTNAEVTEVSEQDGIKSITYKDQRNTIQTIKTESLLLATGVRGNADILKTMKTGVEADPDGFIKVNNYFETTKPRIWALGDAIGRAMFKHVANREAELVWHAFDHGHKQAFDFDKVPYAIFSWPEVASVGLTEEECQRRGIRYLVGKYQYGDTAYGSAMGETEGFAKLIIHEESYKILGCHIIGPDAPILIHEIIVAMNAGEGIIDPLLNMIHIHPALSEVVQRTTWRFEHPTP